MMVDLPLNKETGSNPISWPDRLIILIVWYHHLISSSKYYISSSPSHADIPYSFLSLSLSLSLYLSIYLCLHPSHCLSIVLWTTSFSTELMNTFFAERPTLMCLCVGAHKKTLLMNSSMSCLSYLYGLRNGR